MDYTLREMNKKDYHLLKDFLYEAIFIPKDVIKPPKSIINAPELQVYIENFGKQDDNGVVAEVDGKVVGAAWVRIMNDYGSIDDRTPSLAISVYEEYRKDGIGTALMKALIELVRSKGYFKISLAVQKDNYAFKMYRKVGFEVVGENEQENIMVCNLQ
jgi:ribosomal protein S18 acetylase RimI-like enzyme